MLWNENRMRTTDERNSQKLTPRQNYLLNRIPNSYEMKEYTEPEPTEVVRARKLTDRYDERMKKKKCAHKKRMEALRIKAREAVYFASEQKALAIVQQCEKMLKGCAE